MCGVCGVLQWTEEPVADATVAHMAAQLRHRGPDHLGVARPQPWIGLGHTRLSVIDLSAVAHQPMTNESRTVWIVYNGEIYNYRDLRAELQGHGATFISQSDTEVILRAYEQWGEACVPRLDGMFAFAIWDSRTQQLLCARDRTGKKPFFYYEHPSCFVFGSEIKALLAHPRVPDEVNADSLPLYLAYGYVPAPETCYRDINILPPGHTLVIDRATRQAAVRAYWDAPFRIRRVSQTEARAEVRRLVIEAVRKRLIADVPLGAFLSGGIDSTIIVGIMRHILGHETKTFSIGFQDAPAYDETRFARIAAQRFGTQHTEFIVEPQSLELLETLIYHHDQPFGDSSAIPTFLLAKLTRQHVTVALNGDGGDELFAGYARFLGCGLAERMPPWVRQGLHGLLRHAPQSLAQSWPLLGKARRFAAAAYLPVEERWFSWIAFFARPEEVMRPEFQAAADRQRLQRSVTEAFHATAGTTLLSQLLSFNLKHYLASDLHVKMDRCSMAHGLETRSPLLDTALIEYAAALPDEMKLRGLHTKVILREAFADLLPPAINARGHLLRKQGFNVPIGQWFRGGWREYLQEMLMGSDVRLTQYVDGTAVQRLVRAHLEGREDHTHRLWCLLTLELWLRLRQRGAFHPPQPPQPKSSILPR